jgi:PKD repeat protein
VVQRGGYIKFVASAPSAKIYEWDFGDGSKENGSSGKIDHVYAKSGIYNVKLTVRDSD